MIRFAYYSSVCLLSLASCREDTSPPGGTGGTIGSGSPSGWNIPQNQVFDGGPGKDGIPALENPEMIDPSQADYLSPDDLVIGYRSGPEVRAYSHKVLDWHEIINDQVSSDALAVTYCPLTGTAIGWDRVIENTPTTFGVSGLLYNSNLIPYDRATDSNWSQMRLDCVNGTLIGKRITTFPLVETTWQTWQAMYPNTKVVSTNTGHSRNYDRYPYGDYRTNHSNLIFPIGNADDRLPNKERVLGVLVNGKARVYPVKDFGENIHVVQEAFEGRSLVVVGSAATNFAVAFNDRQSRVFSPIQDAFPAVMEDERNNRYDVFGEVIDGPDLGERLLPTTSYIGYWFAWAGFYPDLSLYQAAE